MAVEIADFIQAVCVAGLNVSSIYFRQNGFAEGLPIRIETGVYVLRLQEPMASGTDVQGTVDVTPTGTPATIVGGAIIPSTDPSLSAYAGHVAVRLFDAAGAARDGVAVNVTVKKFPNNG